MNSRVVRNTRPAGRDFDRDALLNRATIQVVAMDDIDLADARHDRREARVALCTADDFVSERGTVDCSNDHAVLLEQLSGGFRVVNGFRRLARLAARADVTRVRCRVLAGMAAPDVAILASRFNLAHGLPLSPSEKRRCFEAEQRARRECGYARCSERLWARIYGVSPTTIGAWLRPASKAARGVHNGQSAPHVDASATAVATSEMESHSDGIADLTSSFRRPTSAQSPAEAVEALSASVEMIEQIAPDVLHEYVDVVQAAQRRLAVVLQGLESLAGIPA